MGTRAVLAGLGHFFVAFLGDYLLRLYMALRSGGSSGRWNLLDLFVVSVPFVALIVGGMGMGFFRVFRMIRLVRIIRAPLMMARTAHQSRFVLRRGQGRIVLFVAFATIMTSAVMVWKTESVADGAKIHSFADAVWWSVVTMFTVGYGELYPVTPEGKVAAFLLMLAGIALFGWITATLASLFVESEVDQPVDATRLQLAEVSARLESIERMLMGHGNAPVPVNGGTDGQPYTDAFWDELRDALTAADDAMAIRRIAAVSDDRGHDQE